MDSNMNSRDVNPDNIKSEDMLIDAIQHTLPLLDVYPERMVETVVTLCIISRYADG